MDYSQITRTKYDVLIMESTYGSINRSNHGYMRQLRVPHLLEVLFDFLKEREGNKPSLRLFPAFSLGRSQELFSRIEKIDPDSSMLDGSAKIISEEVLKHDPEWFEVPLSTVYTPATGRANIIASSGWLEENTASWIHYNRLKTEDFLIFTGYIHPNSRAHEIICDASLPDRPMVMTTPFSSHASLSQLAALAAASRASCVVLVHGYQDPDPAFSIDMILKSNGVEVLRPKIGEIIEL